MTTLPFIYLAEITAYDPATSAEVVLRYSTGRGFITAAADTPATTPYEPVIEQAVEIVRSIFAPGTTQGQSKIGFGDLVLLNPDGELDVLLPYSFDGRSVVIKRGLASATTLVSFTTIFVGTMEQAEFDVARITIKLRDKQAPLQLPIQPTTYAGTNVLPAGVEGVVGDLAGKPKPLLFGVVTNIAPPCVNTARLIYQVNDGAITSLDDVYDRGVALTLEGTYASEADVLDDGQEPSAGMYKVYLAGGLFRLGSSPAGTVTADVTQGATAADRTAAALYEAVLLHMGVIAGDILASDLTALDAKNSAECGIYIDTETKAAEVLDAIANSVGAWWGVNAAGEYRIVRLEKPAGSAVLSFVADDLIGPPVRQSTADIERGLPAYKVTVRYARNYTKQTTDVAGSVTDARRAELAEEWREATATDTSVQTVHLLAAALSYDSLFATAADAATEAARRLTLRSVQRHRFNITVPFTSETSVIDLGDTVGLLHPRYGLTIVGDEVGQLFVVLSVEPDARSGQLTLSLWGSSFSIQNLIADNGDYLVTSAGEYLVTGAY